MHEPRFEEIRPRTHRIGRRLVHLASVTSTMDEARRLAAEGAEDGTIVVADEQTGGRGRNDRTWFSPRGSIYATIIVRPGIPAASLALLPVAAGVSTAVAIEKLVRVRPSLKWPNDVWIDGKKVGGVLAESRLEGDRAAFVLIGIGVNGDVRVAEFPAEMQATATSLSVAAGRHVCMPALLKLLAEDFERRLDAIEKGDADSVVKAATERSAILGHRVRVETPEGPLTGTAKRFGPRGELIVTTNTGETTVRVGDCLLLRPVEATESGRSQNVLD